MKQSKLTKRHVVYGFMALIGVVAMGYVLLWAFGLTTEAAQQEAEAKVSKAVEALAEEESVQGEACFERRDYKCAADHLQRCVELYRGGKIASLLLALSYLELGQKTKFVAAVELGLQSNPIASEEQRDWKKAQKYLEELQRGIEDALKAQSNNTSPAKP